MSDSNPTKVVPVSIAVIELASRIGFWARLSERQATEVALVLQNAVNDGRLVGKVITGDHLDENKETVFDWSDLEKT